MKIYLSNGMIEENPNFTNNASIDFFIQELEGHTSQISIYIQVIQLITNWKIN